MDGYGRRETVRDIKMEGLREEKVIELKKKNEGKFKKKETTGNWKTGEC